jgi:hypothetical protein
MTRLRNQTEHRSTLLPGDNSLIPKPNPNPDTILPGKEKNRDTPESLLVILSQHGVALVGKFPPLASSELVLLVRVDKSRGGDYAHRSGARE